VLGACAIVYLVIIRASQLPDIAKLVESVDDTRAEQTYSTTADIIFWSFFGVIVAIALVQIALLVSFSNRRPKIRWWLLALRSTAIFENTGLPGFIEPRWRRQRSHLAAETSRFAPYAPSIRSIDWCTAC